MRGDSAGRNIIKSKVYEAESWIIMFIISGSVGVFRV